MQSSRQYLIDYITRHQVYVERHAKHLYDLEYKRLVTLFINLVRQLNGLDDSQALIAAVATTHRAITKTYGEVEAGLLAGLQDFSEYETAFNAQVLQGTLAVTVKETTPEVARALIRDEPMRLVNNNGVIHTTTQSFIQGHSRAQTARLKQVIADGVLKGQTGRQIAKELSEHAAKSLRDLESVTLTSVAQVNSMARKQTYRDNADVIDREQWVSTLDSRTTLTCQARDLKEYPVGEGDYPPAHFRCRSVRVPIVKDEYLIPGTEGTRAKRDVDGGDNREVSGNTRYETWLKRQPASFQDDVLGKTRGRLFRQGGLPIERFVDQVGRPLTLDELRAIHPAIFAKLKL